MQEPLILHFQLFKNVLILHIKRDCEEFNQTIEDIYVCKDIFLIKNRNYI